MDGFQCFSGKVLRLGEEAFIKEAGDSCIRGEDPIIYGMKILKQSSCPQIVPATFVPMRPSWRPVTHAPQRPTGLLPYPKPTPRGPPYWYHTAPTQKPSTTRSWKPITGRPPPEIVSAAGRQFAVPSALFLLVLSAALVVFLRRTQ